MGDLQLEHLAQVLTNKRVWALNVGENFQISIAAWARFTQALAQTAVGYMYVSEHHLKHTDLKLRMRNVIRINRKCACSEASGSQHQTRPCCAGTRPSRG